MDPDVTPTAAEHTQDAARATDGAATPRTARSRHGWLIGAVVAAAGAFSGTAVVLATPTDIEVAATAEVPADRIITTGQGLLFPIEPAPMCLVFNNFGAYSKTYGAGGHQGVDIGATLGQPVYAVENGVLERHTVDGPGSAAGNGWILDGDTDTQYRFYHLSAFADGLHDGDRVAEGQLIGYVGDTGNATPGGYHLHFEVRPGPSHDSAVDPVPLLDIPRICTVYPKQG